MLLSCLLKLKRKSIHQYTHTHTTSENTLWKVAVSDHEMV